MARNYSLEDFGQFFRELDAGDDDIAVRVHKIGEYLELAKESWQYETDAELKAFVDTELEKIKIQEEKETAAILLQLKAEMMFDAVTPHYTAIRDLLLPQLLSAYQSGNRDMTVVKTLRDLMSTDINLGCFDASRYNGLQPDDLPDEDINSVPPLF